MATQDTNNLVETVLDTQKKVLDTVVENTRKFTSGNNMLNDTLEKGSEWYKNWLDGQKNFFSKTTNQAATATETVKESANKMNEFYENWMGMQMNLAKQMWEMNQDLSKNMTNNTSANPYINWQNSFNSMNTQWNNWMNNLSPNNWNWSNSMPHFNPFNMDSMKGANNSWNSIMNQYYNVLNNSMAEFTKGLGNHTAQDAFKNMVNIGDGFTKFAELWMPMFKTIQDKSFNMDIYRQMMKPELYKDMMDKYFGFMPETGRSYVQNMMNMMTDASKQMSSMGIHNFGQMRGMAGNMGNMAPVFQNVANAYTNWQGMMNDAVAPFTRMVTPTEHTKAAQEWADIANRIALYNIKNAELQYMVYTNGIKVMDKLAEYVAAKIKDGKDINSIISLYQEWLNISDKSYVGLFESDEYSQLMAEVGSMQMKLRKDIALQNEKMLENIPVATRSEMDEMHKAIYDLKSQIRQLQSMMELDPKAESSTEGSNGEKTTTRAKKSA